MSYLKRDFHQNACILYVLVSNTLQHVTHTTRLECEVVVLDQHVQQWNCKEQVAFNRCCLCHGRCIHSYLLNNEERPE
jgi:hypothetical protein